VTTLLLAPPVLSLLVLGAHFYRAASDGLVALCMALAIVACVPRRWAARATQAALVAGALVWGQTIVEIARVRMDAHQPWGRTALILGGVALFTLASALVFSSRRLRLRYEGSPTA